MDYVKTKLWGFRIENVSKLVCRLWNRGVRHAAPGWIRPASHWLCPASSKGAAALQLQASWIMMFAGIWYECFLKHSWNQSQPPRGICFSPGWLPRIASSIEKRGWILHWVKPGEASGPDAIPPDIFKAFPEWWASFLTALFPEIDKKLVYYLTPGQVSYFKKVTVNFQVTRFPLVLYPSQGNCTLDIWQTDF